MTNREDAENFRSQAQQCRALAHQETDARNVALLSKLAAAYDAAAELKEKELGSSLPRLSTCERSQADFI